MKLLKVNVKGLELFDGDLNVDFLTRQRVRNENSEMLFKIAPKMFQNNVHVFAGINASGKTTTLKALSFVIKMMNNEPVNSIESKSVLLGLKDEKITFEIFFYESEMIYKLESVLKLDDSIDNLDKKYRFASEKLWCKKSKSVKTKKAMFDFEGIMPMQERQGDEEFLPDDVSIIISLNKKNNSRIYFKDLVNWTNINLIHFLGGFPEELVKFLDPSIEYLKTDVDKTEKEIEINLKFMGKPEIYLKSALELENYLSSGTIKGLNVFISAMIVLKDGGYLLLDELENHFNKEIANTLIRFFMNKKVNTKGAMIMFSTHYPELLDEFERNDNIHIVRNNGGIQVENLSNILLRNDIKKSEVYQSGYLDGTVPMYESFIALKKAFINFGCD